MSNPENDIKVIYKIIYMFHVKHMIFLGDILKR